MLQHHLVLRERAVDVVRPHLERANAGGARSGGERLTRSGRGARSWCHAKSVLFSRREALGSRMEALKVRYLKAVLPVVFAPRARLVVEDQRVPVRVPPPAPRGAAAGRRVGAVRCALRAVVELVERLAAVLSRLEHVHRDVAPRGGLARDVREDLAREEVARPERERDPQPPQRLDEARRTLPHGDFEVERHQRHIDQPLAQLRRIRRHLAARERVDQRLVEVEHHTRDFALAQVPHRMWRARERTKPSELEDARRRACVPSERRHELTCPSRLETPMQFKKRGDCSRYFRVNWAAVWRERRCLRFALGEEKWASRLPVVVISWKIRSGRIRPTFLG